MAKRTRNGLADPYLSRRTGLTQRGFRQTPTPFNHKKDNPFKDDAQTSRDLAEINREYQNKEIAVCSVNGPHSIPEQHYEKSVKALPQPEEYKKEEECE